MHRRFLSRRIFKVTSVPSTPIGGEDEMVAPVDGLDTEEDFAATDDAGNDDF